MGNNSSRRYQWFKKIVVPAEDESIGLESLYRLFLIGGVIILVVFIADVILTLRSSEESWHGAFGDFFGGVVNPILTFLTFMGLLITIVMQRVELRESRKELQRSATALDSQVVAAKRQSHENTFFKLVESRSAFLANIGAMDGDEEVFGRRAVNACLGALKKIFESKVVQPNAYAQTRGVISMRMPRSSIKPLKYSYDDFWRGYSDILSQYYSGMYVALSFIDASFEDDMYIDIYRSSFSEGELILLYYFALCRADEGFKVLLLKFDMLAEMKSEYLLTESHKKYQDDLVLSDAQYK